MIKRNFLTNVILSLFGILLGVLFFFINSETLLRVVFVLIGIYVIFLSIPGFINFSSIQDSAEKNATLIASIILAAIGLAIIIYPNMVVNIIAGVLFIGLPIYRIVISKNRQETLKNEILKICLGVVLILVGFSGVFQVILYIIGALLILFSLTYLIYNIVVFLKYNRTQKQHKQESDVIDL